MRFVGMPEEVFFSFIIGDDGKFKYMTLPDKEKYPTHIFYKIVDRVLDREYLGKDDKGDSIFEYHCQKSHPEIFNMVYNNGKKEIGKYGPNGWVNSAGYPNRAMLANVINRAPFSLTFKNEQGQEITKHYDADHCKTTGKTLLLSKDSKNSTAPITVYEELLTKIFPVKGTFWKYDIAIKKIGMKPWYSIITASDIKEGAKNNAPEMIELAKLIKDGEYPEEQKYQKHDLVKLAEPVSYQFIYDNLKIKISQIDEALGTNFLEEIEDKLSTSSSSPFTAQKHVPSEKVEETPEEEPVEETLAETKEETPVETKVETNVAPVRRRATASSEAMETDVSSVAPFLKDANGDEKSLVTGVKDGKLVYSSEAGDLLPCPNPSCSGPKEGQPENIATLCIYCGQKFE
jgi:hypothetical protein